MSEITRDDWLDCLEEMRVGIAKMSDSDPWKATQQSHLKTLETVEKKWSDIYDRDPSRAEQLAKEVVRILEHHLCVLLRLRRTLGHGGASGASGPLAH